MTGASSQLWCTAYRVLCPYPLAQHVRDVTLPSLITNSIICRCLAHIINLATQALILTHSKSKHYDPAEPDADLTGDNGRDVVGLVRAISVKVTDIFCWSRL